MTEVSLHLAGDIPMTRNLVCCGARHPPGYVCTRDPGHEIFHVAHGGRGHVIVAWFEGDWPDLEDMLIDVGL